MTVEIVNTAVERYVTSLLAPRDHALAAIEEHAEAHQVPIVGPVEGLFLHILTRASAARRVLEVGTATGYSAIWLGRAAAQQGGSVTSIEYDPTRAGLARENVKRAGLGDVVEVLEGDAFAILPTLSGPYDVVFVDILRYHGGDPVRLGQLLDLCIPLVRIGGLLLSDNVLHGGEVAEGGAAGMRHYNERLTTDLRLSSIVVPLRDGVGVSLRVG